jgi:hypothetical protein
MTNKLKTLDWLADVIFPLLLVLMETFWVYPWLVWLGSFPMFAQPRPPLSLASVFLTLAAATLAIRFFNRQKWTVRMVQAAVIGCGLVVILLVLGSEYGNSYGFPGSRWFAYIGQVFGNIFTRPDTLIVALPALLYLWWRGINLGQMTFSFKNIYRSFLIAISALIVLIIIWQISSSSGYFAGPGTGIGLDVLAVFFFGLLAIAISHLYTMRSSMPREEAALTSVWRWLPIMLTVIGGMVIVVFVIAGFFSPGFFTSIGHFFGTIFHFLGKIFEYILVPFNFLFEGIIWVMRWMIARIPRGPNQQPNDSANMSFGDMFPKTTPAELSPVLILVIKWLVFAVIFAAVIFILARAVSRFRARRAEEEIEEIHESLFSWRGLGNDLRELLGMMGKKQKKSAKLIPAYDIDADESRRMDIREIYWRLLREASLSGLARGIHETPAEYSRRLGRAMPAGSDPIARLTDMYSDVRYGEIHLPEEKITISNDMWWRLYRSFGQWRGQM